MDVLKKINKMRIDRGWSVYRLAVESGVSQSTITNMFNRETLPSITTLEYVCSAFGVTLAEFFTEDVCDLAPVENNDEVLSLFNSMDDQSKECIITLMKRLSKK